MTIYENIQERVEVTLYSNYLSTHCVFHDYISKSPSLFVYEDADKPEGYGRFYCSSCGKSGTHKYLWTKLTGVTPNLPSSRKEQKFLPNWKGWNKQFGSIEELVRFANENVTRHPGFDFYFKKRNLLGIYEQCMLGYKDEWILFPIFDPQGKIIDVICRDSKGRSKYIIHPDDTRESPYLYVPNWKRVMSANLVYIVYGIVDALALELCELPVITGSTGKSLSYKRLIQLNKKYVIIPDKDEEDAARKLATELGNFTRIIRLPFEEDEKDPDDIRMKRGLDVLKKLITGVAHESK